MLLKKAAERGLSPYQIGTLMCRDVDEESVFEGLFAAAAAVAPLPEGSTHGPRGNDSCGTALLKTARVRDPREQHRDPRVAKAWSNPVGSGWEGPSRKGAAMDAALHVKAGVKASTKGPQGIQSFKAGGSKTRAPVVDLHDSAFVRALSREIDVYFRTGLEKKMIEEGDPLRAQPH